MELSTLKNQTVEFEFYNKKNIADKNVNSW